MKYESNMINFKYGAKATLAIQFLNFSCLKLFGVRAVKMMKTHFGPFINVIV